MGKRWMEEKARAMNGEDEKVCVEEHMRREEQEIVLTPFSDPFPPNGGGRGGGGGGGGEETTTNDVDDDDDDNNDDNVGDRGGAGVRSYARAVVVEEVAADIVDDKPMPMTVLPLLLPPSVDRLPHYIEALSLSANDDGVHDTPSERPAHALRCLFSLSESSSGASPCSNARIDMVRSTSLSSTTTTQRRRPSLIPALQTNNLIIQSILPMFPPLPNSLPLCPRHIPSPIY